MIRQLYLQLAHYPSLNGLKMKEDEPQIDCPLWLINVTISLKLTRNCQSSFFHISDVISQSTQGGGGGVIKGFIDSQH